MILLILAGSLELTLFFPLNFSFDILIFMNSTSTVTSTVSCQLGNKNNFFFWILVCLLPRFLGNPVEYVNFQLLKAIVRCPSSSVRILESFGEAHL